MTYALENKNEYDRLEKQSQTDLWDPKRELLDFKPTPRGVILDAGSGSGIVTRYLASLYPEAKVIGCDQSEERVKLSMSASRKIPNISFQVENLNSLSMPKNSLDGIVCRYVLHHLSEKDIFKALSEMHRCLKPEGQVCLIDVDGYLANIYPQTFLMSRFLSNLTKERPADVFVGRKLPYYLSTKSFENVKWKIETLEISGNAMEVERGLMKERFAQTVPIISRLLGSKKKALLMEKEYLETMEDPNSVLFYNKFIITATKPGLRVVK